MQDDDAERAGALTAGPDSGDSSGGEPAKASTSTIRRRALWGLAFGVAVIIGLALFADARELAGHLGTFAPFALVPALGLVTAGYFLRYVKWEIYLGRLGIRLGSLESGLTFVAGMVMSISPGKVGEVLKSFIMRARHGVPVATSAPIVVAERLTDLIAIVALAAWGVSSTAYGTWVIAASGALVLAILVVFSNAGAGRLMVALVRKIKWFRGIADKLAEALASLRSLLSLKPLLVTSGLSVGAWVLECLATWVLLLAFPGVDVGLGEATFIFAFATLAGAVSMLPGGLGLTEGSMIALLTTVFEVMPSVEVATAATLIIRFCTLWYGVLLGALASWLLQRRDPALATSARYGPPSAE